MNKEEKEARKVCKITQGKFCKVCKKKCSYWRFYLKKFRRTRLQVVKDIFEALFKC